MNPLTVAIVIIIFLSGAVGVFVAQALLMPRLTSRRVAFVAAAIGVVMFVALYFAAASVGGYTTLTLLIAPMTIILVCATGAFKQAVLGFRQHNHT